MLLYPLFLLFACLSLAFAVTPGQAEEVQLAWDAPLQASGTPFTTLAGYKLSYGASSRNYQTVISVGTATTYTVTNLSPGQTYYFAVTASSTTGEEGVVSDELRVTLPANPPAFDFVLAALSPLTVTQGVNVSTPVALTLQAGTAQPVTLTVSNLPPGVTASWSNSSCTPSCTSVLTLSAGATASLGVQTLTVVATGPTVSHSTALPLTVVAVPALVPPPVPPTPSTNLLVNGDMEAGPWQNEAFTNLATVRSWATDSSHSPAHALKTTASAQIYTAWRAQVVPVTPGTDYQVAIWARTEAITDGVYLNVIWRDSQGTYVLWASGIGGKLQGTRPWQQITGVVKAPSQARQAVVEVRILSQGGTAWLDDALLAPLTETPAPTPPLTVSDTDNDGLSDAQEAQLGTNPQQADTDGDGLSDGAEVATHRTNPLLADTDGDGLTDKAEITAGTDPLVVTAAATQNTRWEQTLTSTQTYANPFTDVTVSVEYTKAGLPPIRGYGFWDGGSTFKLRQAFPESGTWSYTTTATNPSDSGLHNRQGTVVVLPYSGANALYRHGFPRVSADQRFLAHADGTPFLWLGDTLWNATVWLTEAGFREAVADRRTKHFTVLQTNFARKAEVDTNGDTPWDGDRWNVRFMQKLDRMFSDANDQGMYLFVNGLVDLKWDRNIAQYERLVEMIAIRYAGHYLSLSAAMDDQPSADHDVISTAIARVSTQHLLTQHLEKSLTTTEQYYDKAYMDYVMVQTGSAGNLEVSCYNAIEWPFQLYKHASYKPVVNGETWYEGYAGGTAEIAMQLGYLSMLSGSIGYNYGTDLWNARDADLPAWKAFRGATYMQYLYDFFVTLDEGRPMRPRPELIKNQPTPYQDRMAVGVSADGLTYAAFAPKGGAMQLDLAALSGSIGVTWYDPLTGQYRDQGTVVGGAVRTFTSPFGTSPSALVLIAQ